MIEKASFVMDLTETRLHALGADWSGVTDVNIYTVHALNLRLSIHSFPGSPRACESEIQRSRRPFPPDSIIDHWPGSDCISGRIADQSWSLIWTGTGFSSRTGNLSRD